MSESTKLSEIADKILKDQILLQKLTDRIYQLMTEDVRNQLERNHYYRRF